MKKYISYFLCFMVAFSIVSLGAKAYTADGNYYAISGATGDLFSGFYCKSDNANIVTKEVKNSDGSGSCYATASSDQSGTITYGNSHSGEKNTVSISFKPASTTTDDTNSNASSTYNSDSAADAFNFCNSAINPNIMAAFKLGSIILLIIKIIVPIILIVLGMIDMSKAVISDNQDSIKKNALIFARRLATGILVFLTPTILLALFNFVDSWNSVESTYKPCIDCLLDTSKCPKDAKLINTGSSPSSRDSSSSSDSTPSSGGGSTTQTDSNGVVHGGSSGGF